LEPERARPRPPPPIRAQALLRPLLAKLLLHEVAEDRVHAALIAGAAALEIGKYVFVDADGDRLFPWWRDKHRFRPVEIERNRVGVATDRAADLRVAEGIDGAPVSPAPAAIVDRADRSIFVAHLFAPAAPR